MTACFPEMITSFRLVQQGDSYAGIIKGDSLILSIPENLSLEGAIMEILCSENARISPDPGEVEDWGKLQNFTVTAYNNTQRVYKYIVRRTLTGSEGLRLKIWKPLLLRGSIKSMEIWLSVKKKEL